MPLPLHKSPKGLLGAFDLKAQGLNPTEFGIQLAPVVDVQDYYLQPNATTVTGQLATAAAPGTIISLIPGVNAAWRVKAVAVELTRNVADIALIPRISVSIARAAGQIGTVFATFTYPAVAATDLFQIDGLQLPRTMLVTPGDQINVTLLTTLSANATVRCVVDLDDFPF